MVVPGHSELEPDSGLATRGMDSLRQLAIDAVRSREAVPPPN